MPPRRSSAAGGHYATSNNTSGRVHRSNGSNHNAAGPSSSVSPNMASYSSLPYSNGSTLANGNTNIQHKIVDTLVNRLKDKLPCYSLTTLADLENNDAIQQAVESLVDISRDSLDIVAWALTERLDKLRNDTTSITILQSEVFLLKVLSIAMAARWRRRGDDGQGDRRAGKSSTAPSVGSSAPDSPGSSSGRMGRGRQISYEALTSVSPWVEPPPLDDSCAKYILHVMALFLRDAAPPQQRLMSVANLNFNASYHDLESIESIEITTSLDIFHTGPTIPPSIGSYYPKADKSKLPSFMRYGETVPRLITSGQFPQHSISYERTSAVSCGSISAMNSLIAKFAGRIVYHLSASNWPVVFQRIKNKIHALASTSDEDFDIMDVKLMQHCSLDRARLVQLLTELSSLLVNMKSEAQVAVAGPLRTAVWNWIEFHRDEFNDSLLHRRLEGTPERVFDLLFQVETTNKATIWPVLAILMCISSDRIRAEYNVNSLGIPRGSRRKERGFVEALTRAMLSPSKFQDAAIVCMMDICRAASRVKPGDYESPLLSISIDIAHDVRQMLAKWGSPPRGIDSTDEDKRKPFYECPDEIDVALVADAMVTLYRFLPESDSIPVFVQSLQPEMSDAVKIAAVKACITLITESPRLEWQRSLSALKGPVMARLYAIFMAVVSRRSEIDVAGIMRKANYRPKAKRYTTETLPDRELLLHAIMALWRADVTWFIEGIDNSQEHLWISQVLETWHSPVDNSIKYSYATTIRYIQEGIRNSPTDSNVYQLGAKWMTQCGAGTMAAFGMCLLLARNDFNAQRMWIGLGHELMFRYTRTTLEKVRPIQLTPERVGAFAIAEIAFLVSLTSADRTVSATSAQCLRLIAGAERQRGSPPAHLISEEEKARRYPVYEQLGDPKALVLGRVADQKRVRKLIRLLAISSPGHVAVWEECYFRWRSLGEMAARQSYDPSDGALPVGDKSLTAEQRQAQWHNLTLFLASFGACCLSDVHDPSALAAIIPLRFLPDQMRVLRNPSELLANFISELINLLLADSAQVRDLAREALSVEAHPRLYSRVLRELDQVLHQVTESGDAIDWDHLAIFLEQFISIVKVIVENVPDGEEVRAIDMTAIFLKIAALLTRLQDPAMLRLKLKFCSMCDSFLDRSESFPVRKDNAARIGIADLIIEWTRELSTANDSSDSSNVSQREMNASAIRTVVKLFDRLGLQPTESTSDEESGHSTARHFNKYFNFLYKMSKLPDGMDDGVSEHTTFSQARPGGKEVDLRETIINGMASLISANTEIGVKQCLSMTDDADPAQRIIFAHVFARVVAKGIQFEPQEVQTSVNKHSKLCELIKGADTGLALAMCSVCPPSEVDQMINVLLNMFDTRSSLMSLLKSMINREIRDTENEASLFRSNSTCTRFLSAFARIYGYNYLRNLIIPLVKTMTSLPSGHSYDLDPTKAVIHDAAQNQKDLEFVASSFLEIISASIPALPSMFREICAHIGKTVNQVWPEAKFSALGAFIFLRFISPAIVNPSLVDVEAPTDPVIRRGLMNIAKIVQNLANNIFFGKEVHMTPLNDFLSANIVNITRYLSEVNKYTPPDDGQEEWLDTAYDDTDIIVLHRFFDKHADKVGKELLSSSQPEEEDVDDASGAGKRLWNSICNALVDTTQASVIPIMSTASSAEQHEYRDLMARYSHRDTSPVKHLFVPAATKGSTAVFVLSVSRIDVEALDLELLLYYCFKTVTSPPYEDKPFDIIIDWTAFSQSSQIPTHWLKFAYEILPIDIRRRFRVFRNLTPNALALRYMRRLYNLTNGASLAPQYALHTSTSELLRNYPEETRMESLQYAIDQEHEDAQEFEEVYMRHNHPMRIPVTMHIGSSHLRITALKTTPINNTLSCRATEIIPLADISDIYNVAIGNDTHEFVIRKIRHGSTLFFTSPYRDTIVKIIRAAKGSMRNITMGGSERFSKLSSVIATLLHVGMINIGSDNEELRLASYDLLCAVCTYLDFEGKPVVPTKAIFIPGRAGYFVTHLSEKLALFAPQLTLDFIQEMTANMSKSSVAQRINCLHYMSPWVKNLYKFTEPTSPLYEQSGARLRDCVRVLIDLTMADQEIHAVGQKAIWQEIGKLDSELVNTVIDELIRAAVDGGIGSQRCEVIADTMSAMSSINVRGHILSRIRKTLGKTSLKPSKSLSDNVYWNELACLTRLALVAVHNHRHNQLYVPETAHFVTLLAGTGQLLVRTSIYGVVVNLLHSMYLVKSPSGEATVSPEVQSLLDECASSKTLKTFGLRKPTPTSDYTVYDPPNDKQYLESLEQLSLFLARFMEATAGSRALLNVWRARWMSLVTSSAFQLSPAIQTRAFVSLGILATSDVDDDLLYQMLVALKKALSAYDESDTTAVVSMLKCICKVIPALPPNSRYLPSLFWLAVALLESSHMPVYIEAIQLLQATLESMFEQGSFKAQGVAVTLLESRHALSDIAGQLDSLLGLSFSSNFSFALSAIIFKGVRHQLLKEYAESALRSLLKITVQSCVDHLHEDDMPGAPLCSETQGYFMALLPLSTTNITFRRLLDEAGAHASWSSSELLSVEDDDDAVSAIPFGLLGVHTTVDALYLTSFIAATLITAQGDDTETEMLFNALSDVADVYPETISMTFESLQDKVRDVFAGSSNASILSAASNVFRVAMQDPRHTSTLRGSSSTLSTVDETSGHGPGRIHLNALEEFEMQGLTNNFHFLPAGRGLNGVTKMIQWISELVSKIIE
ncbi:hypothetical protein BDY19DRAFT_1089227 [Irpex rosettiformis]|uniref:Uncharacterized protein n=1 Tax=Irpex rosettiformis TaxID=378272 RepID=A0ACB8U4J3_9APHY|nr:hypothetical protein BDY19DRAFT_1089227 [Irpex rosettiformis]